MPSCVAATIRVVIVDPQPLYRDGLARAILRDNALQLAAELDDGRRALDAIRRLRPDVAVLDMDMPGLSGRRVLGAVVRDVLRTRIVLLTADLRPEVAFEAMAAGAGGYLSKRVDGDAVRDAIRRVASGDTVLCAEMQTVLAGEIQLRHRDHRGSLSGREHEVLVLIAEGLNAPEIARRLHIATGTARGYIARIYERLGVGERAQAVAEAMRRGLLD